MPAKQVKVVPGAYNGNVRTIIGAVKRTTKYINDAAEKWSGSQEEYNGWALQVMQGCLRGTAEHLVVEEPPGGHELRPPLVASRVYSTDLPWIQGRKA